MEPRNCFLELSRPLTIRIDTLMWNPISDQAAMADFWPPRPNGIWRKVLTPVRKFFLKKFYAVSEVHLAGTEHLSAIRPDDGVLLTPNHSHDADPHVMIDVGR